MQDATKKNREQKEKLRNFSLTDGRLKYYLNGFHDEMYAVSCKSIYKNKLMIGHH
jgi:hypothetical protein